MIKKVLAAVKGIAPDLWYFLETMRLRLWAERKVKSSRDPILVFQMAKVGSTTVVRSLRAAGLDDVFHIHFLSGDPTERLRTRAERSPASREGDRLPPPDHLYLEQALQHRIQRPDFRCKIITLVRDPIARQISGLFQSYHWLAPETVDADGHIDPQRALDYLHEHLESLDHYDYVFNWFDNELKAVFGIDVFAHPFDRETGYTRIEGDNAEVLVLRLENLSDLIPTAVSDFTGRELDVVTGQQRANLDGAETYRVVKQNITVSPAACRKIYNTPFVRHFYGENMIAGFIERWSSTERRAVPGAS